MTAVRDAAPLSGSSPGRARSALIDLGTVLAVALIQLLGTYLASRHQSGRHSFDALALALLAIGTIALYWRRRYPEAVLVVVFGTTLAYSVSNYPRGPVFAALIVAFVNAVMAGRRRLAWSSIAAGYVLFLWLPDLFGTQRTTVPDAVGLAAWLLVLAGGAELIRSRRERAAARARSLEEEARRRSSEERLRIARELHDVVAHNISLINVQAGSALHLMDQQPERARTALTAIKDASKEALVELRSVLGVLRQLDEGAPRSPTPGLDRLDEVVARASSAGLPVQVEVEGPPTTLPPGVDLAAYRIVQEALTNVARHAGPAQATVRISYGDRDLVVQIDDDGLGAPTNGAMASGNGIVGMRERATSLGGNVHVGPRPGGGFRVRAWLPVDGAG
ncbi:MAG TPA: sensor histidine kinase [Acidimicrobiales bacterium]|nr:sensor histidine kinase [Acidimicrobiales bacterium]